MNSASIVREARLRAGLSQKALGDRLGTTQSAVARWEAGRTHPSAETLGRLANACGLELRPALIDLDPGDAILIESTLLLTPEQRLDALVRTVSFIRSGRRAVRRVATELRG
jgi:transcriptional regulator with XRE-family HTH domain